MSISFRKAALAMGLPLVVLCSNASAASPSDALLEAQLAAAAPALAPKVLKLALSAMQCAMNSGLEASRRLAVIDYSLSANVPRMWVFDLNKRVVLHKELVAHGKNSGEELATRFSNRVGSYQSSIGLFRTGETYDGRNGYSLRMEGLEPGINDKAYERAIVIHGAPYVDREFISETGRLGRSQGCPAVAEGVARRVIDSLKEGQFVFSYYPDRNWLASSRYLHCNRSAVAAVRESLDGQDS
ncbi:murein L,D-transpeptidase catalytic domain family protein [Azoarcus sp. L1K30]|uniref:murein L,D-transpeptidase catalytic domain family protein n=1 Tax=Azoarcus sp. L1K30 TaxID=2820277 RepID=UPI001B822F9C|nr:murein L,D-transpeptidase catalytic domain family protein [Azoarcus sp. L1K30]MBR0565547.1 murein L,D-transpeptidase catalytic domain family protein [Azoarcus sp. L1K30]